MAGGKETTRQKMINIMYLVLIAMLALNVSDSVLNAFRNLNESLTTSKSNVSSSVDQLFTTFEATKMKDNALRAKPILDTAKLAKQYADELTSYVEDIKKDFMKEGEGIDPDTRDVTKRSDMDIAPRYMINQKHGTDLKNKINETREKLVNLLSPKDRESITFDLSAPDPKVVSLGQPRTWEAANFGDGTPLTAAITVLTKIQSDTKNAESEVVKKIFGKMDQAVVTLDQFKAVIVAPTSYILTGQPYTADVFLTAYDSKSNPIITVDGRSVAVKDGKGQFSSTYGEGPHTITAQIAVKGTDGQMHVYHSDPAKIMVARPSAVVSADKMNVFYIGVPNPVSVSAPGVPKESIKVSMTGGEITGSNGHYEATVKSIGTAKITVTGDKGQELGVMDFRTKRIPPPKAVFAGKSGGTTSAANIKAQERIFAKLDGFDFDAKFTITHFTLFIVKPRQDPFFKTGTGNILTPDMKTALNGVAPGTNVFFKDITAVGPDGIQQEIDPIILTAN